MAITWADVVVIAPKLSTVPIPTQNSILATTLKLLNVGVWGDVLDEGHKYLCAHMGTQYLSASTGVGAVGAVSKYKVGPVEVSYQTPTAGTSGGGITDTDLSATSYGQTYLMFRRTRLKARIPFAAI